MNIDSKMKEVYQQMLDEQTNNLKNLKKSELFITKREFDEVHIHLYYNDLNQIVFYTYKNYDYLTNSFGDYKDNNVVIYLNNIKFDSSIVNFYKYVNQKHEFEEIVYDCLFSKTIKDLYDLNVLYIYVSDYYKELYFDIRNANKELGMKLKLKCNKFKSIIKTDSKIERELIKMMSIKTWFEQNNPTEFSIPDMNPNTTFEEVYRRPHLADELISVYETAVREIVFDIISDVYEVDYEEIYDRFYDN